MFFTRENEAIKHDLVEFKVQCLKVFCYHGNKYTILLFYLIFRTPPAVSSKLYFVETCQVLEKLWLFNHKRADFWLPNFGFKRSLLSLLKLNPLFVRAFILGEVKSKSISRVIKHLTFLLKEFCSMRKSTVMQTFYCYANFSFVPGQNLGVG